MLTLLALLAAAYATPLAGTWETDPETRSAEMEELEGAVDELVGRLPFYKRAVARKLLRDAAEPCRTVAIEREDEVLSIQCDDELPAAVPADGQAHEYVGHDGRAFELVVEREDGALVQTFTGDHGTRINRYAVEDGVLVVSTEIVGNRLPDPLAYRMSYHDS